jgi:hypothetical protein
MLECNTAKNNANIFTSQGGGFSLLKRLSTVNKVLMGNAMPTKSASFTSLRYPVSKDAKDKPKFPSPRYFQIHFEHLKRKLTETRQSLLAIQSRVADLNMPLSLLTSERPKAKSSK